MSSEAIKLYALWVIGAPSLVLFILILMLLRPRRKISLTKSRLPVSKPDTEEDVRLPSRQDATCNTRQISSRLQKNDSKRAPLTDTQQVLQFFMRLFKHQQNVAPDAPCELNLIEQRTYCPNDTYEMRVLR